MTLRGYPAVWQNAGHAIDYNHYGRFFTQTAAAASLRTVGVGARKYDIASYPLLGYLIISVFSITSGYSYDIQIASIQPTNNATRGAVVVTAAGSIAFYANTDGSLLAQSANSVVSQGQVNVCAVLVGPGSTPRNVTIYLNGVSVASGSGFVGNALELGPRNYGSGVHSKTSAQVYLNAMLVADETPSSIHADPWQIFAPERRIIYFDVGASVRRRNRLALLG